ncbi:MAG: hypothetical protein LBM98_10625 [Oscillospiraceae bacterium]|nr:hypothetical protein [Oscillospiraceae bacterium]
MCERILSSDEGGKVHHTTREHVMAQFERNGDDMDFVDSYLRYIALGENELQNIAIVGFD